MINWDELPSPDHFEILERLGEKEINAFWLSPLDANRCWGLQLHGFATSKLVPYLDLDRDVRIYMITEKGRKYLEKQDNATK